MQGRQSSETLYTATGHEESDQIFKFTFTLGSLRLTGENKESWLTGQSSVELSSISISLANQNTTNSTTYYAVLVDHSSQNILALDNNGFKQSDGVVELNFNTQINTTDLYDVFFVSDNGTYQKLIADLKDNANISWKEDYQLQSWQSVYLDAMNYYNSYQYPALNTDKGFYTNGNSSSPVAPNISMNLKPIPEPSVAILSVLSLCGIVLRRRNHTN